MGCPLSKPGGGDKVSQQQNARIEKQIREDKKTEARTVKILLLGRCLMSTTRYSADSVL
jgi:guanine nucleotide-binding protein subunit alpha